MNHTATHSALPGKTEHTDNNKKAWKRPKISLLSSDDPRGAKNTGAPEGGPPTRNFGPS
jgi:hypothetical protein